MKIRFQLCSSNCSRNISKEGLTKRKCKEMTELKKETGDFIDQWKKEGILESISRTGKGKGKYTYRLSKNASFAKIRPTSNGLEKFFGVKTGSQREKHQKPEVILTKYPKFELGDIMNDDLMSLYGKVIVIPNPKGSARKERTVRRAMSNFPHYKKTHNVLLFCGNPYLRLNNWSHIWASTGEG